MTAKDKVEAYYARESPFREAMCMLRTLALQTRAEEDFKWSGPVYTAGGKNVFGIMGFKHHFGLWFFNGVYLKDPLGVLEAAQKGTRAMRHWKFTSMDQIQGPQVLGYLNEAIDNQEKGLEHRPVRKKAPPMPPLLRDCLEKDPVLQAAFKSLAPYKQREYCEHIGTAKQEKTRRSRLEKCLPLIRRGLSMNDQYR